MSGGSYEYLAVKDSREIFDAEKQLQRMADDLAKLGYAPDAAKETMEVLLEVRQARNRLDARLKRLYDVWHAMEWWKSCDSSEDEVRVALLRYRNLPAGLAIQIDEKELLEALTRNRAAINIILQ